MTHWSATHWSATNWSATQWSATHWSATIGYEVQGSKSQDFYKNVALQCMLEEVLQSNVSHFRIKTMI